MPKKLTKAKKTEIEEEAVDLNIDQLCSHLGLELIHKGSHESINISTFNINRPGMLLAGYGEHFGSDRVQVIGEQEMSYLATLSKEEKNIAVDKLFSNNFPCIVVSSGLKPCPIMIECAKKYNRVMFGSSQRTTMFMNEMSIFLNEVLAPKKTIHGVLMDVYGVGLLIVGKSSVGKSETALELVQRTHRLVADDAVCIKRVNDRLVGSSPPIIRYFMEVRGIGIIDIRSIYGSGSVKHTKVIDLVIQLEEWDSQKEYNRLGNVAENFTILDVELPMHTIPVKPGRNLAVILEVAARNYRLKSMGYDTLAELDSRMNNGTKDEDPFDF